MRRELRDKSVYLREMCPEPVPNTACAAVRVYFHGEIDNFDPAPNSA